MSVKADVVSDIETTYADLKRRYNEIKTTQDRFRSTEDFVDFRQQYASYVKDVNALVEDILKQFIALSKENKGIAKSMIDNVNKKTENLDVGLEQLSNIEDQISSVLSGVDAKTVNIIRQRLDPVIQEITEIKNSYNELLAYQTKVAEDKFELRKVCDKFVDLFDYIQFTVASNLTKSQKQIVGKRIKEIKHLLTKTKGEEYKKLRKELSDLKKQYGFD